MKFKLYFNEEINKLVFNILPTKNTEKLLPDDLNDHVHYPIPAQLTNEIKDELDNLLTDDMSLELIQITDKIKDLTTKRQQIVNQLRVKINPKIINVCERVKENSPEYFV